MRLATRVRISLNELLARVGLEVSTTRLRRAEEERIREVEARGHWDQPRFSGGLDFDREAYEHFLAAVCSWHRDECAALHFKASNTDGYHLDNEYYSGVDAYLYYCIIHHYRPRRIVEIGSGHSTLLARAAVEDAGLSTHIRCIDPSPRIEVAAVTDEHVARHVEAIEPQALVADLEEGDVLFIDSSHAVSTGGDVTHLLLETVPHLHPGVLVHLHDIFLPFEYPRAWVVEQRWDWTEQYLVHAFLAYNREFEILFPARYAWDCMRPQLEAAFGIELETRDVPPSSLWIRRSERSRP